MAEQIDVESKNAAANRFDLMIELIRRLGVNSDRLIPTYKKLIVAIDNPYDIK